ncbi:uncharacterized protein [Linepithema humile]|uniref:uncharacterized protein n=1 Tax=Linepithema humile TaxID=83485 RepID=UPI00351DC266
MYFKYLNLLFSQCIICDAKFLSTSKSEDLEDHLNSHSEKQRWNHILRSSKGKYWTQRNNFVVECNICHTKLNLYIHHYLDIHIRKTHSDKLKNMQETHDPVDSSERVSSLETNITFMPLCIATKKHIWEYYTKLTDFKAQCKYCEVKHIYINDSSFKRHIRLFHKKILEFEEEKKLIKEPWMYFKYSDQLLLQCIICDADILSTSKSEDLEDHLSSHSEEQRKNHILQNWKRKYWTQRNDFEVECDICNNNISLQIHRHLDFHIRNRHSDKLKIMQETHEPVDSSERVSSLETNITFMPLDIATKKHIWEYYINLTDFKAQCKYCEIKYIYINDQNFKRHIRKFHIKILEFEEEKKLIKGPWMYFKYSDQLLSQCIICDADILSTSKSEDLEDHLNSHSEEQRKNHILQNWKRKYWTQRNDFVVECSICNNNISLDIIKNLDFHIRKTHLDKLKIMQETHDPVDSSERVSSLETNVTFMPLDIATKKHIWEYYIKLTNFEAQCKFCGNKYIYIDNGNFIRHIAKLHEKIWKYEEGGKLRKRPWMYFKRSLEFAF